jgi:hypothetical protein
MYNGPNIITDGLVLHLDAANVKSYPGSGTTWSDLSGNGNNGTLVNGVGYSEDNQGIMVYDGVNDYINLGNFLGFNPPEITIEVFSKRKNTGGQEFSCEVVRNGSFYFRMDKGAVEFRTWTDISGDSGNDFFGTHQFNEWYHMVALYDSSNKKVWMNGEQRPQIYSVNGNISNTTNNLVIGGRFNGGSYPMDANIGFVKIYNKALTAPEVLQNYNATKSRFGL